MRIPVAVARLAALVLVGGPMLTLALPAAADKPSKAPVSRVRHDANNVTGISEFMETCVQANARFISHDIPGSIELYKKAIQLQPRNPLGHYLLGQAQLSAGTLDEAVASFLQADQVVDSGPPDVKAKVLFVLADMREREKKWDEAKAAWQRYAEFCSKHTELGLAPASAASGLQVIDDMQKQDKAYECVRQRFQAERQGGAGQNGK